MRKTFFPYAVTLVALASTLTLDHSHSLPLSQSTHTSPASPPLVAQSSFAAAHIAKRQPGPAHPTQSQVRKSPAIRVPLEFEANRGQAPGRYRYVAHGPTYSLGLTTDEIALSLHHPQPTSHQESKNPLTGQFLEETKSEFRLRLLGASSSSALDGLDPKPGKSNYFIGNDPAKWHTDVPHFGKVKIASAYPGIDLVFYGNPQQLEYDFQVAPGADPHAIRVAADGATSAALDLDGNLNLATPNGDVQLKHPDAYQEIGGRRRPVQSEFELAANNTVQFRLGDYDHSQPLVIDPVLLYGVSIGGTNGNRAVAVDVDASGNAYVTGNTCSADFPSTAGNFQTIHSNPGLQKCYDAFVMKLDPTASTILYSDYIGGSSTQNGSSIAVDSIGAAYVTGLTTSTNFPLVNNIGPTAPVPCNFSSTGYSCPDAFIFKLSSDGSQLLYSSLLGGNQASGGFAVKLDSVTGDLLVLGATNSSNFSPAPNTLESTYTTTTCLNGIRCMVGFLAGLNPATGAFRYGTYFSGAGSTFLTGLAVDSAGDIYLSGSAAPPLASSLGTVSNTYAPTGATAAGTDIVVARLHPASGALSTTYLTFIQGEADEAGAQIAVDSAQNAYVAGSSASLHLPVTSSAFQASTVSKSSYDCGWIGQLDLLAPKDCGTGFVGKLTPTGTLSFLTYLGGTTGQDSVQAIGVDSLGSIWLTGDAGSSDFPLSSDAYPTGSFVGFNTPFLARMSNDGSQLPFSTAIGGFGGTSTGLKVDGSNNVYVTGAAINSFTTPNAYPTDPLAYNPLFVQKWGPGSQPILHLSSSSLTFPATPLGGITVPQTVTVQNTGTAPLELGISLVAAQSQPVLPSGFQESDNCGTSLAAGASCTITANFEPAPPAPGCSPNNGCYANSPTASILIQNNAAAGSQSISLSGTTGHGAAVSVSPNPIAFGPQAAGTTSAPVYVEVQNQGDVGLTVSNATIAGANAADFQITSIGTCNNPIPLGLIGCNLYVAFSPAPSATGTRTASLVLTDNAGNSPQSIPMTGLVTGPGAALTVTPGPLFLGIAAIGAASSSSSANIFFTNSSTNTSVQVTSLALGGPNAADFSVARGSCSSLPPFSLSAGGSCFVVVSFLPTGGSHGLRTATLTPSTNPAVAGLPVIALSASAVTNSDPSLSLISVPAPQDFGSIQVGQSSYAGQNLLSISTKQPVPCAGAATTCGGPLTISSFATGLPDYTVVTQTSQPYCTNPPLTIPAGGYGCTFQIIFSPTAAGNRNTTLAINSNDPAGPTIVPLFGSGLSLPLGNLSATQLNFGPSAIGIASPPLTVTLQNIGQSTLSVAGATTSANFSVASNNCPATLAPNAACTIAVSFTPPTAGPFTGTLTITDNGFYGAQQTVVLNGTGATGPQLRLSSTSLNFGTQAIHVASPAQTLTLANTGDTIITFPAGAFRATRDFNMQDTTCGATLALGASCVVNLQFTPSVTYADSAPFIITDNARGNPQEVTLIGTGTTTDGTPTIVLTSSANPSATGLPVTFTVTVAGATPGLPVPTGSVTFSDSFNFLGTVNLNSSGQASVTTSTLAAGNHYISANFNGSSAYASVASTVLTEVVNGSSNTATTTAVISSLNPSVFGQTTVFTATITGSGGNSPTPTGNVIFLDGTTTLGTVPLNGAAQALLASGSLSIGSHSITAMYAGNANYAASTSAVLTQTVAASTGVATTTSLTSSANPSSSGQVVVFTASVAGSGGNPATPTGTITFMNGSTVLGTVVLNGSAQASYGSASLSAGSYSITAIYSGDATFAGSSSSPLAQIATSPPYIWTANGNSTLSKLSEGGLAFSPPGGYPGGGLGIAIDGFGNVWSGSNGSVTMLNSFGAGSASFGGGGIAIPASIAIAGDGSVWIANTNGTMAALANNGTAISPSTGYNGGGLSTPTGLAIDSSGNVWITNSGDSSLTEFVGAAPPVVTPLASAVKNGNQGGKP